MWQPIETAPLGSGLDHGPEVLVWTGWSMYVAYHAWDDSNGKPVWFEGGVTVEPTHWMPLPDPPK